MKRLLSLLFVAFILSFVLTGCGEQKETGTSDNTAKESTSAEGSSKSDKNKPKKEPEKPKEPTPEEEFDRTLTAMLGKFREMGKTGGFNFTGIFGLPEEMLSYPFLDLSINASNEEGTDHSTLNQLSINNGTDAVEKFEQIAKEGTFSSAVYFDNDKLFLRVADLSKPLIQYTLPSEEDGKLLKDFQPMNRFMACVISDTPGESFGYPWEKYMEMISFSYKETGAKVKVDKKTLSSGSINEEAKSYIIELEGKPAVDLFSNIQTVLTSDFYSKQLISTADNVALDFGEISSLYSLLNIYMDYEDIKLRLEVCTVNNEPVALFLNAESEGGTAVIELTALQKDGDKAERLFTKFTHAPLPYMKEDLLGGYSTLIENTLSNGEQICNQIVFSPEGEEKYKLESKSTGTGTDDNRDSNFQMHFKSEAYNFKSKGNYHHKKSGTVIDGNFSGKLTIVHKIDGKKQTSKSNFEGTIVADEKGKKIEMPEVLEGSVVKVSNRKELSDELYPDLESASPFNYIDGKSPFTQYLSCYLMLTFTGSDD